MLLPIRLSQEPKPSRQVMHFWKKSVALHGKPCRCLAVGVRAADTALRRLSLQEPEKDRLVCVSESDSCCVDAIQACLGCTMGQKHLLFFNTGRLIFSIYDLQTGASVRLCLRPEALEQLSTPEEILSAPEDRLFTFEEARPMTPKVLKKVNRGCKILREEPPALHGSVHDSSEPFRAFDESKF